MKDVFSARFSKLIQLSESRTLHVQEVIREFGGEGQPFLCLLFSLPFLFFIPLPGLSTIFGAVILVNGFRMGINCSLWIPKSLLKRRLSSKLFLKSLKGFFRLLKVMEKYIRPRGHFFQKHPGVKRGNGWVLCFCGFLLMLPLPPGTNFTPALTSTLICLGMLEKDSLLLILGYLACVLNIFLYVFLPLYSFA